MSEEITIYQTMSEVVKVFLNAFSPIFMLLSGLGVGLFLLRKVVRLVERVTPHPPPPAVISNSTGWDDEEDDDSDELYQNRPRRNRFKRLGIKR